MILTAFLLGLFVYLLFGLAAILLAQRYDGLILWRFVR